MFLRKVARTALALAAAWALNGRNLGLISIASAQAIPEAERTFELRIEKGKVEVAGNVIRVRRGERVRLRWTADTATELHLHGYDIELHVTAAAPAEMAFEARATGRFPVTVHASRAGADANKKSSSHGGEKVLLYLEVHPR